MKAFFKILVSLALIGMLAGCSNGFFFKKKPEVTRIVVLKEARRMYLLQDREVVRSYRIDLGFAPIGDKKIEGDGKTPEGLYFIDRRNPESLFHLSLGISYPNESDVLEAKKLGHDPGGDIFIHGRGKRRAPWSRPDWTWGCIAVTNREMEEIFAMVPLGTPFAIYR